MKRLSRRGFIGTAAAGASVLPLSLAAQPAKPTSPVVPPTQFSPLTSTQAFDEVLKADPGFLDRTVLGALIETVQAEKTQDLRKAGLSPNFVDNVNGPWEMLLGRISRFVAGGDVNGVPNPNDTFSRSVQVVTVPMAATWDDPKYGPYRLCKILGDSMPKWLPTYEPAGGNSFGDGYGTFIQSVSIPAPTVGQQQEIDLARTHWQAALLRVRRYEDGVGQRWVDYSNRQFGIPLNRRLSYDQYYAKYERPVISSMRRALTGYEQILTQKINDYTMGYGLVANMIGRFSSETAMFQTPGEGTGDDAPQNVYRYLVDHDLGKFKARAATQDPASVRWDFSSSSFRLSSSQSYWGGSASYGFFVRGGAGGSNSHVDWQSKHFRLTFKAKSIEKFIITPGDWYTGQLIKLFKDGPFVSGSVADVAFKSGNLWAPHGILDLRASSLIVVYEPTIEITVSKQDYEKNASEWHAGGGISIGCFSFGASAGGSSEDIKFDPTTNTIHAADTTGVPKLMAVENDALPNIS